MNEQNASSTRGPLLDQIMIVVAFAATAALVLLTWNLTSTGGTLSRNPVAPAPATSHTPCRLSAEAAQAWLDHGAGMPTCLGPVTAPDRRCAGSADTGEYWIRHTGRLPDCPSHARHQR